MDGVGASGSALVLLAKWPGSGAAKTRLTSQLADTDCSAAEARKWAAAFIRAAVQDLVTRFAEAAPTNAWQCVLVYAPPVDEARAYFSGLLDEAGVAGSWRIMPVLASSDAKSASLGDILADAARRARQACGTRRVAFFGADCPELPVSSMAFATKAAANDARVAAICPASDGGYTLLALPEAADEARCFDGVHWSASDTCLSQLAALTRAGLLCVVGETHADVDELGDLRALATRLRVHRVDDATQGANAPAQAAVVRCPRCEAVIAEMVQAGALSDS